MTDTRPIVFLGTPSAASTVLHRLVEERFEVAHVVTRPDARRGRGSSVSPSPVKEAALQHGIAVSHNLEWLDHHANDRLLGVVVAYGRIIPVRLLERMQMVNLHFSLLPRWRGAAPVERAILAGDPVTGVCLMELEPTLDTGPVFDRVQVAIDDTATTATLTDQLAVAGAGLLVDTLRAGFGVPEAQVGEVTYADKISAEENRIDWNQSAVEICRQVRALRAHTFVRGARLRVIACAVDQEVDGSSGRGWIDGQCRVATGEGTVRLLTVQPEGRAAMDAGAWLRGLQPFAGIQLG